MSRGGRTASRWVAVAALAGTLLSLPALIGALPVPDAGIAAPQLRARALDSSAAGFSGVAESAGGLTLPVNDRLTSVSDLFSDRTTMRVWWRGSEDHRVDVLSAAGETGIHRDRMGTWVWEYERATATRSLPTSFALPSAPDLLPTALGRRLLSEVGDDELSRIGARRVAGRDALGLRLVPAEPASSVDRVDLWIDGASGLPLQVEIFGKGSVLPALDSRFLDLEVGAPDPATIAFRPPAGARVRSAREAEIVLEAGQRIRPVPLPDELAGLPRRRLDGAPPAIGLYGRGVTLLAVAPVPNRLAGALRDALAQSPEAIRDDAGTRLAAGPVGLMLVEPPGRGPYLLTGTVTLDALAAAAAQLPALEGDP